MCRTTTTIISRKKTHFSFENGNFKQKERKRKLKTMKLPLLTTWPLLFFLSISIFRLILIIWLEPFEFVSLSMTGGRERERKSMTSAMKWSITMIHKSAPQIINTIHSHKYSQFIYWFATIYGNSDWWRFHSNQTQTWHIETLSIFLP